MFVPAEAPVNMSADHEPRSRPLDGVEQLATPDMLDAPRVQVERPVPVVERRVDATPGCRPSGIAPYAASSSLGVFMNAQRMNLFDHGVAQTDTCRLVPPEDGIAAASSTRI